MQRIRETVNMKPIPIHVASAIVILTMPSGLLADAQAQPTAAVIVSELLMREDSLHALSLEYRTVRREVAPTVSGGYVRRVVAARRPNWFMRDNGHGHDQLHWKDDPFRKTMVIDPNGWRLLSHLNRVVDDGPPWTGAEAPADPEGELIFQALCWWPYPHWNPPEVFGRRWAMRSLMKADRYTLRKECEDFNGRLCLVLEVPNLDVLWLDRERPSCVLRRDVYNPETGSVAMRFEFNDYKQYMPHVWLPGSMRNVQFDSYAHTPALRERRVIDSTFLISNISVNDDVGDEAFELDLPPGTVRRNASIAGEERFEPLTDDQADHLASIINWGKRRYTVNDQMDGRYGYKNTISFLLGFVFAWFLCGVALRFKFQGLSAIVDRLRV